MSGRVLITGATGFVGRAIVWQLLRQGRALRIVSRNPDADFFPDVDVVKIPALEDMQRQDWLTLLKGVDYVIHGAAIAHIGADVPETLYHAVNGEAVLTLADAARGRVKRMVFLSSIRAQAGLSSPHVLSDQMPPKPTDAYGRAKLAAENGLFSMSDLASVVLRPVLVCGPGAKGNLETLVKIAKSNMPLPLSGLKAKRSLISRADIAQLALRALDDEAMSGGTFIAADPEPLTVAEMIGEIREGLGMKKRMVWMPESLIRVPLQMAGKADLWNKIGGNLVARPQNLLDLGWQPILPARLALRSLGEASLSEGTSA